MVRIKTKCDYVAKKGKSIRDIEIQLSIPRSTLSGWLKNIHITDNQKSLLKQKHENALVLARKNAAQWHNQQKVNRLGLANTEAEELLKKIHFSNEVLELTLSLLYLGEGAKKKCGTSMGNSDPLILRFFIAVMQKAYNIPINKMSACLHLRADQDENEMKKYWSQELSIPVISFRKTVVDKRTINNPTYPHYKGVCVIECGNVAVQRKLVYIGRKFCEKISK